MTWSNLILQCTKGPKEASKGWLIAVGLFMAVQPHGAGVIPSHAGVQLISAFSISFPNFRAGPAGRWDQASCVGIIGTARPLRKNQ